MFPDLNNFLDVDVNQLPTDQCILVVESAGSNGGFVLANLLSLALRGTTGVCLVGLAQTFHHYRCVANKMALNLVRFQETGQLVFVEALKSIGRDLIRQNAHLETSTETPFSAGKVFLRKLFQSVKEALDKLPTDAPPMLVIDDLSILTTLGCRDVDVSIFFQYLRTQVSSRGGTVATLVQRFDDRNTSDMSDLLDRHVAHQSDVIVDVRRLKTGYCRELNGEISVRWKNPDDGKPERKPRTMHFKVADKTVSLFPPGMSAAVL